MAKPKATTIQDLLSIHNYFNRLDSSSKSETTREIINQLETQILYHINPTGTQTHGKSEIR